MTIDRPHRTKKRNKPLKMAPLPIRARVWINSETWSAMINFKHATKKRSKSDHTEHLASRISHLASRISHLASRPAADTAVVSHALMTFSRAQALRWQKSAPHVE